MEYDCANTISGRKIRVKSKKMSMIWTKYNMEFPIQPRIQHAFTIENDFVNVLFKTITLRTNWYYVYRYTVVVRLQFAIIRTLIVFSRWLYSIVFLQIVFYYRIVFNTYFYSSFQTIYFYYHFYIHDVASNLLWPHLTIISLGWIFC